jgi:hypothetical protein
MIYSCCNEVRRAAVLNNAALNGIDYLEVLDSGTPPGLPRQQILLVHCLNTLSSSPPFRPPPVATSGAPVSNVMIEGGESITNIAVDWVIPAANISSSSLPPAVALLAPVVSALADQSKVLVVRTHVAGDFSTYRLRLVNSAQQAAEDSFEVTEVLAGFDPQLADVEFCFKVECPLNFDCAPLAPDCAPAALPPPPINYLAKDYGSFRTIILDRLNQLLPGWGGSSEADLGVALAELIAYVGDHLSYRQDAIATEAYLETARLRTSLRRHALLVDYRVSDGCNARTWMQIQVSGPAGQAVSLSRSNTRFYTSAPGMPSSLAVGSNNERAAIQCGVQVFEPMHDSVLYPELNQLKFYTWGDTNCCLPRGATEATLLGSQPSLRKGDVLIFQEVKGPQTGNPADADVRHRCAVRLTDVATQNGLGHVLVDPLFKDGAGNPQAVTEIQWSQDDALPFPLCISSAYLDSNNDQQTVSDVSLAFGNVVLADHGLSFPATPLQPNVPEPRLYYPPNPAADRCQLAAPTPLPVRYRPTIAESPLTQAIPLTTAAAATESSSQLVVAQSFAQTTDPGLSAYGHMNFDASTAIPAITLTGTLASTTTTWLPQQDLLESGELDPVFVVEVETDGTATLRFGDDINGMRPKSGTAFTALYRIGNGAPGNVGADTLTNMTPSGAPFLSCRNPLPATGGTDPETNDQIRRRAPQAFLTQERAVTMADYNAMTELNSQVDRASTSLRWTGSWYTVFIAVEPNGGGNLAPSVAKSLKRGLERYRLAGQDLVLDSPQYVSLEIVLTVCVDPYYFNGEVKKALLQVLSNRILPSGQKGVFYPDNFTFGQTVYLSPVYAAARSVAGVVSVTATTFQPQGVSTNQYLNAGEIQLAPLQVARLDNDPSFPDHGQLTLNVEGGK